MILRQADAGMELNLKKKRISKRVYRFVMIEPLSYVYHCIMGTKKEFFRHCGIEYSISGGNDAIRI